MSYRFHLAHSTLIHDFEQRQTVYVSQPEMHQIIRIKNVLDRKNARMSDDDIEKNWEPFVGNGKRCLPGDSDKCGDGGQATNARLAYPKGNMILRMPVGMHIKLLPANLDRGKVAF